MPDWLVTALYVIWGLIALGSVATGGVLLWRYENPYRLAAADWKQKWLWAASLPFLFFVVPFCAFALLHLVVSGPPHIEAVGYFRAAAILVPFFLGFTVVFRIRFIMTQWQNERYSRMLKDPKTRRVLEHPFFKATRRVLGPLGGKDHARFLAEGFPDSNRSDEEK
jgi:hypothetical protein